MHSVIHKNAVQNYAKDSKHANFYQKKFVFFLIVTHILIIFASGMAWKHTYRCDNCGYTAEIYEGRGYFRQKITPIVCTECNSIRNIVVGGIIADVAPSFGSEVGRLCPKCGNDDIRIWDMHTCPKCKGEMKKTDEKEFWT